MANESSMSTPIERLSKLSDLELIKECLKTPELDHPVVEALMDRLVPGWIDQV